VTDQSQQSDWWMLLLSEFRWLPDILSSERLVVSRALRVAPQYKGLKQHSLICIHKMLSIAKRSSSNVLVLRHDLISAYLRHIQIIALQQPS